MPIWAGGGWIWGAGGGGGGPGPDRLIRAGGDRAVVRRSGSAGGGSGAAVGPGARWARFQSAAGHQAHLSHPGR